MDFANAQCLFWLPDVQCGLLRLLRRCLVILFLKQGPPAQLNTQFKVDSHKAMDVGPNSFYPTWQESFLLLSDVGKSLLQLTAVQSGLWQGQGCPTSFFYPTWQESFLLLPNVVKGLLQLTAVQSGLWQCRGFYSVSLYRLPAKSPSFFCLMKSRASLSSLLSRVGSGKTEDVLHPASILPGNIPSFFCLM
jgi:hypothetical protein